MRPQVIAQILLGRSEIEPETIEALATSGQITDVERSVLLARHWLSAGERERAQQILTDALATVRDEEREVILEELVRLLADQGKFSEAEALLLSEVDVHSQFRALMEALIALRSGGRERAISHLKTVHGEFPRNRIVLENLVGLLLTEAGQLERARTEFGESKARELLRDAQNYAERLVEILPAPETRMQLARIREVLDGPAAALRDLDEIAAEGYTTRTLAVERGRLLLNLERPRQAADVLEHALPDYSDDYEIRLLCGTAWAAANETERAIDRLAPLADHSEADWRLFVNLGQAYLAGAGSRAEWAGRALDAFLEAYRRNPAEETLPGRIVMAGLASGRERDAWNVVSTIDLTRNPHLRPVPFDEAVPLIREMNERAQLLGRLYEAGLLPFLAAAKQAAHPSWFIWLGRISNFRRAWDAGGPPTSPLLVDLPSVARTFGDVRLPAAGVLMDITAVLTLGALDVGREVLESLRVAGFPAYILPGCRDWLDVEIQNLQLDQLPAYRDRFRALREHLERARRTVDIRATAARPEHILPDTARERLGGLAFDVEHAITEEAHYLDDHLDEEQTRALHPAKLATSPEVLSALVRQGLITAAEEARARRDHPVPFGKDVAGTLDFGRPIVFSEAALLAWYDAGLLGRWLEGGEGWPRIIVGPWAWARLMQDATEASLYRLALERAQTTKRAIEEALLSGVIREQRTEGGNTETLEELGEAWGPALETLRTAHSLGLAIWADDLFLRLITDIRGLLPEDPGFRRIEARVRERFPGVQVLSTELVLDALTQRGALSQARLGELSATLFTSGYRVLSAKAALRWWLSQTPYDHEAIPVPYRRLLRDLERIGEWISKEVGERRRRLFVSHTLLAVVAGLIIETWSAPDPGLGDETRGRLAESFILAFEKDEHPPDVSRLFWTSLSTQLALATMPMERHIEALKWLGECAASPGRVQAREEIARALEDGVLRTLEFFTAHDARDMRSIILRMLLPLVETPLVNDTDWTFRRLVGFVIELANSGGGVQNYHFQLEDGREVQVAVPEAEIEAAAIEALRSEDARRIRPPRVSPAKIEISLIKVVPGQDRTINLRVEVPFVHLLFAEDDTVRGVLLSLVREHLTIVDPPLLKVLSDRAEALESEDAAVRHDAQVTVALKYLDSTSFLLKRDPRHGFKRLSEMSLGELDEYLALSPASSEDEVQRAILGPPSATDPTPLATRHSLLLLTLPYEHYRAIAESLVTHVLQDEPERRERRLGSFATEARFSPNVFTGVAMFFNLAFIVFKANVAAIDVEGGRRFDAAEWVKRYVAFMLQGSMRSDVDTEETARRRAHAYILQLSMWASASQRHVTELSARTSSADGVVVGWLLRGLILSDRVLPVFFADSDWSVAEMPSQLRKVVGALGITINTELYPDVFNPFVYGPDSYDHATAALLRILLESWDDLRQETVAVPLWWSDEAQAALTALAARPETEGETRVKTDRAQKKPNRLGAFLDRTPQELAGELLSRSRVGRAASG